jgi:alpha-amylase
VIKRGAATAAAAAVGTEAMFGTATAAGEDVALQYFDYGHNGGPAGGHWQRVASQADAISDVGYRAVWVQQPCKPNSPSSNGYNPKNHRNFDQTSFGTEYDFSNMADALHSGSSGYVELYVDTVLNHMGSSDPATGAYPFFSSSDFHYPKSLDESRLEGQLAGLWDLKQEKGYVRGQLYDYVKKISDLGADGYRWDAAKHIPQWFWRDEANRWANDLNMFRVGEVFDSNVDFLTNYTNQWVNGDWRGQNVFDFPLWRACKNGFSFGGNLSNVRATIENGECVVGVDAFHACPFIESHDNYKGDDIPDNKKEAYAFILTIPGYPFVYDNHNGLDGTSFDKGYLQNLVWIANNLAGGDLYFRHDDQNNLIYERDNNLLMGINQSGSWTEQWVYTTWRNQSLNDYSGENNAWVNGDGWTKVSIPPGDYVALAP